MADNTGLTYTDEEVQNILSGPSLLTGVDIPRVISQASDWDKLTYHRKEQIRVILHGVIMTEYLRENKAPRGLLVSNAPRIFLADYIFRKDWAAIAWRCTRDWLVLIIKTAKRLADQLEIQIKISEDLLRTSIDIRQFKKKLEEITNNLSEFKEFLTNTRIERLRKDMKRFSYEKVYPYSSLDFEVPIDKDQDFSDLDTNTSGSDHSDNEEFDKRSRSNNRSRNRRRGRSWSRHWSDNSHFVPQYNYQLNFPNPNFYGWGTPYQPGFMPRPPFTTPDQTFPFLEQGRGRNAGRRRGNRRVQWQDNQEGVTTRSKTQDQVPSTSKS